MSATCRVRNLSRLTNFKSVQGLLAARCAKDIVKLMNTPKGQHTVPRLHLQHFAGSEPAGQVWTYDAVESRSGQPSRKKHRYKRTSILRSATMAAWTRGLRNFCPPSIHDSRRFMSSFCGASFRASLRRGLTSLSSSLSCMSAPPPCGGWQRRSRPWRANPQLCLCQQSWGLRGAHAPHRGGKGEPLDPAIKEEIRREMLRPSGKFVMEVSQEFTLMALSSSDKLTPTSTK